jgi:hypothetical protein
VSPEADAFLRWNGPFPWFFPQIMTSHEQYEKNGKGFADTP